LCQEDSKQRFAKTSLVANSRPQLEFAEPRHLWQERKIIHSSENLGIEASKNDKMAVFLPWVWNRNKEWTQEEVIGHLCKKGDMTLPVKIKVFKTWKFVSYNNNK